MTPKTTPLANHDHPNDNQHGELLLADLLDELASLRQAGEIDSLEDALQRYPQHAEKLKQLWPALEAMVELGQAEQRPAPPNGYDAPSLLDDAVGVLGDFRILREVGRGGMGVVYEAQQLSLRRRVALKVLPLAGALDARHLQRFQNEARAAAGLHHTNIVPVFAVGCERGVHYYAMQFIEGRSLADVIGELRTQNNAAQPAADPRALAAPAPADENGQDEVAAVAPGSNSRKTPSDPDTHPLAHLSTSASPRSKQWFRAVATIAVQVAEALEHAHEVGITHRDIKPANLLVDDQGRVWVADFGLAQIESDSRLTATGDVLGTLRYMSPEQAQGLRETDHRADLYSLGATLYELLALRPPFESGSRAGLLQQILEEPPPSLRKFNKGIPVELETIILKTLEKAPQDRYSSAKELADDLGRFLRDEPIRARRPTLWQRVVKWRRRYRREFAAGMSALAVVCIVTAAFFYTTARSRAARHQTIREKANEALLDASLLRGQAEQAHDDLSKWSAALSAAKRAFALLPSDLDDLPLRRRALTAVTELEHEQQAAQARATQAALNQWMKGELDRIRLERSNMPVVPGGTSLELEFDKTTATDEYAEAFDRFGLDVMLLPVEIAAQKIRSSSIRLDLTAAIDSWGTLLDSPKDNARRQRLQTLALAIDGNDDWRKQLYDAIEQKNASIAEQLARSPEIASQSAENINMLTHLLEETNQIELAVAILRSAQRRFPGDFWINTALATTIAESNEPDWNEAIRYGTAAVSLRPTTAVAWLNLGSAFDGAGRSAEAIESYREAIRLKPGWAVGHNNLGAELAEQGRLDEAVRAFREAIRLQPENVKAHANLATVLNIKGQIDEALDACREVVRLNPDWAGAHLNLGNVLSAKGRLNEAIDAYHRAISLSPETGIAALANYGLGNALQFKGHLEEAISAYREAIRLKRDYASAYVHLGIALKATSQLHEAIAAYRKAIDLQPDHEKAYANLGNALKVKGQLDDAITAYREAIRLKPDFYMAYFSLADSLALRASFEDALETVRRCHKLQQTANPQRSHPSAKWVRYYERLVELNKNLPAVLSGKAALKSAKDRLEYADFCVRYKKDYASAIRLYEDAFQQDPRLLAANNRHRYNAACAAALAGSEQGADAVELDENQPTEHRRKALAWLREELQAVQKIKLTDQNRLDLKRRLTHWRQDSDLAAVRDEKPLEQLPQAERHSWRQFWAEVDKFRLALQQKPNPEEPPAPE